MHPSYGMYHHPHQGNANRSRGAMDVFRPMESDHPAACMATMCARQDLYGRMPDLSTSERFPMQLHHSNLFGSIDDGLYAHAEALQAAADITKGSSPPIMKSDGLSHYGPYGDMSGQYAGVVGSRAPMTSLHPFGESMLDQLSGVTGAGGVPGSADHSGMSPTGAVQHGHQQMYPSVYSSHQRSSNTGVSHPGQTTGLHCHSFQHQGIHGLHPGAIHPAELADCDTRELEAFAEHFKQRRIKIGVTQADVGSALGKLKIPGVGSLSQSTICRFESLTLSHNNMVALKPVLQAWLEEAEKSARENRLRNELFNGAGDKKRKRTSIAAPEKRSLEAYFAIQPRPSGEKIAQIADKLDLKKNVVRVWFCNQRQKQKRMKFSAAAIQGPH